MARLASPLGLTSSTVSPTKGQGVLEGSPRTSGEVRERGATTSEGTAVASSARAHPAVTSIGEVAAATPTRVVARTVKAVSIPLTSLPLPPRSSRLVGNPSVVEALAVVEAVQEGILRRT